MGREWIDMENPPIALDTHEKAVREVFRLEAELAQARELLCCCPEGGDTGCGCRGCTLPELAAAAKESRAEVARLRSALERIGEWDCLNPPRPDLLHDLPWLRRLVDDALAGKRTW